MATVTIDLDERKITWEVNKTTAILLAQTFVHNFGAGKEA